MTATVIDGRTYVNDTVVPYSVLVIGSVRDAVRQTPVRDFNLDVDWRGPLQVNRVAGGLFCLAGRPDLAFPDQSVPNTVHLHVNAEGYRAASQDVVVPASPTFPMAASPFELEPDPSRIQGRVTRSRAVPDPVAGGGGGGPALSWTRSRPRTPSMP